MNYSIIVFDGICNLCNSFVNFIIDRDKGNIFKFAAIQSDFGNKLLADLGENSITRPSGSPLSLILIENKRYYQKSTAVLKILKKLNGFWILFYTFMFIPKFIRNWIYDIIAKNRYKWFGKRNECRVPTPELKNRLLE